MVERPSIFLSWKGFKLTESWPLDWRGCFGQRIKWDALSLSLSHIGLNFGLGLCKLHIWPSKLRGRGSSWPKVWTSGLAFEGFTIYSFQPIYLESPQGFGHLIPRPLNFDSHSVKRPLVFLLPFLVWDENELPSSLFWGPGGLVITKK
jgi:hypothetical protein